MGVLDHKWLDHICDDKGCQSLVLRHALEATGAGMWAMSEGDDGHLWVCSRGRGPELDRIEWCQWCGTHKVEVPDWGDNPRCDALAKVRAVLTGTEA